MTANDTVLFVVRALEELNISYMLVGSYSSSALGAPRMTQDADFLVELESRAISPFFSRLAPELEFEPQMLLESVTGTPRYVGKHRKTAFKVEIFLVSNDPFDKERFRRRQRQPFLNTSAFLPTAADVIIQKLRWFERGRRAKDLEDAQGVVAAQLPYLDLDYVRRWCDLHGTRARLEEIITQIRELSDPEKS